MKAESKEEIEEFTHSKSFSAFFSRDRNSPGMLKKSPSVPELSHGSLIIEKLFKNQEIL